MKRFLFKTLCLLAVAAIVPYASFAQNKKPVPVILDTDIGPDYDDAGAMALLHAFADKGEAKILATIASNKYPRIAAVLDVINTYFNRPDLPVAVPKSSGVDIGVWQKWDSVITEKYRHNIKSNDDVPSASELYRKILASQPDKSVVIVTIGFLTNMADLLGSGPDQYSPLSGNELVKKKVKQLVCMAARFDNEMGKFKEFNVVRDSVASIITFGNWPGPVYFSGFEIGKKIFTGLPLIKSNITNSPVKDIFSISIPKGGEEDKNGRMSWDQTAVLIAVRGWQKYYTLQPGRMICNADGSNLWDAKGKGHFYIKEKMPAKEVEKLINQLMMHQPSAITSVK